MSTQVYLYKRSCILIILIVTAFVRSHYHRIPLNLVISFFSSDGRETVSIICILQSTLITMAKTFIIFIATALATVPSIIASSIHNYELNTRNSVACTDPHAAIDPSCWKTLALTDWLRAWDTKTPTCTGQDTSACCAQHEPWSTCFLRLAENYAGSSCYNIDGCLYGGAQLSSNLPAYDLPRYHYIIYNIYGMSYSTLSHHR